MNLRLSYISNSENRDIKKFLTKLVLLSLLFFALDKAVALWATQAVLYDTSTFGALSLLYRGEIDQQIVFFGSSLTGFNVDAEAIEQQTGMTCYNLNVGNASIDMCELFLEEILLKNNKPNIVCMEAAYSQLDLRSSITFRPELLAPFSNVSTNTARRLNPTPADRLAFWFFRCKNYSSGGGIGALTHSMLGYAKHVLRDGDFENQAQQLVGAAWYEGSPQWRYANGSFLLAPFEREMVREKVWENRGKNSQIDAKRQEAFLRIVELTKSEGIQMVLYGPPLFGELDANFAQEVDRFFSQLAEENEHVHYWLFREDPDLLADANLWTDAVHLNWNGAEILTQKIIKKLETLQK